MTLDEFRKLCENHDLTYSYSDDNRYYEAGRRQYSEITSAAKQLPRADAVRIWNEVVDRKLKPEGRGLFYWTE